MITWAHVIEKSLDGDKRCEDPVMPSYIEPLLNCTVPIPMYSNVTLNEGGYSLIGEEDKAISQTTLPVAPPEGANWASAYDQGLQLTGYHHEPSSHCLKIIGTVGEEKTAVVIRTCIDRDLNSQCGTFVFRNRSIRGCMLTCNTDLCNAATPTTRPRFVSLLAFTLSFVATTHFL